MNKTWQDFKEELIKTGRNMLGTGLVVGTWGNLSCRLPEGNKVLITPSGMGYDILQTEDLIVLDLDGNVVEGYRKPTTETFLHLAVYRARPDVGAVVHTHSISASAFAVAGVPIPPVIEELAQIVGGAVEVADYAAPGTEALAQNTITAMGSRNAALLANHGVVGVGASLEDALKVCLVVEKTAQIYTYAKMIGTPRVLTDKDVREMHHFFVTKYGQK